jgi:hypothetical protein
MLSPSGRRAPNIPVGSSEARPVVGFADRHARRGTPHPYERPPAVSSAGGPRPATSTQSPPSRTSDVRLTATPESVPDSPLRCVDGVRPALAAPRPHRRSPAGLTRAARHTTLPRVEQPSRLSRSPPTRRHTRPKLHATPRPTLPRVSLRTLPAVSSPSSLCRLSRFRRRTPFSRLCRRRGSRTRWTPYSPISTRPHDPRSSASNGPRTPHPTTGTCYDATTATCAPRFALSHSAP